MDAGRWRRRTGRRGRQLPMGARHHAQRTGCCRSPRPRLFSIPIAYWLEGDRPTRRSIVGAVIAVIGCVALTLAR